MKSVDREREQENLLEVRYDASKISPEAMLQAIDQHESKLKAKIVPAP